MQYKISKKTILMLSGVSCVGKTTTAYNIIRRCDAFRRVSELDIVRTIVRSVIGNLATDGFLNYEEVMAKYSALFKSLSTNDFTTAKNQSKMLMPYIKEIVLRQQRRNIPTVLEGAAIIPSLFFPNNCPLSWLTKNVFFVNLYVSKEEIHIRRRHLRCYEREYSDTLEDIKELTKKIREQKNEYLHLETLELSEKFKNVFSIDVSDMAQETVTDTILDLLNSHY